ncbi:hypothetical protein OIO90_005819 [Microbotryomycetes sp. JL221]|nr:hypothetical protein OIO90_005819 [Microbotryomycetes sp. JL221]
MSHDNARVNKIETEESRHTDEIENVTDGATGDSVIVDMTGQDSTPAASSTSPTTRQQQIKPPATATTINIRHGRGPLIRDSDEEDDQLDNDHVNEATSLLSSGTHRHRKHRVLKRQLGHLDHDSTSKNQQRRSKLCCVSIIVILVAICLTLVAIVHVWIGHVVEQQIQQAGGLNAIANRGLTWNGPTQLDIVSQPVQGHDGPFEVEMELEVGFSVAKGLSWHQQQSDKRLTWPTKLERKMIKWTVDKLPQVRVKLDQANLFDGNDENNYTVISSANLALVVVNKMADVVVPVSYNDEGRVDRMKVRVPLEFPNPDLLSRFAQTTWQQQNYNVIVNVKQLRLSFEKTEARGFIGSLAKKFGKVTIFDQHVRLQDELPDMPETSDPASLVSVHSIDVKERRLPALEPQFNNLKGSKVLGVTVDASVKNPLIDLIRKGKMTPIAIRMPFQVPVAIRLPLESGHFRSDEKQRNDAVVARLVVQPFAFDKNAQDARVIIVGHLVPPPTLTSPSIEDDQDSQTSFDKALSRFFARYLRGKSNKVVVSYDANSPDLDTSTAKSRQTLPPTLLRNVLKDFKPVVNVPGSQENLQLFKDLKIQDMKIKLAGMVKSPLRMAGFGLDRNFDGEEEGDLLCSGKVVGQINLPKQFQSLSSLLNVEEIWPDVYVYDGALPDTSQQSVKQDGLLLSKRIYNEQQQQVLFADRHPEVETTHDLKDDQLPIVRVKLEHDDTDEEDTTSSYPPRPVPATAFARLHPSTSIMASTTYDPINKTTTVSAIFENAPLYLLPGRSDVFRRFVGKIILGGPGSKTKAGVRGVSQVGIALNSWGQVKVEGMPVEGEFMVGAGGVEQ